MSIKKLFSTMLVTSIMVAGAVSVSAEDMVKVTFVPNDGNEPYTVEEVKDGPLHELPDTNDDGTRTFLGWFTDEACENEFDIETPVTEDFTLYAGWEETVLPFADVQDSDSFVGDVKYVYLNNIMNGLSETEFGPNETLTRAMLVTILFRAQGEPVVNYAMSFTDVPEDAYYTEAVRWAQSNGIVNGMSETEFAPDKNLNRAELACIIYRYADFINLDLSALAEDTNTLSYDDIIDIPEWASAEIHACLATDILVSRESNIAPLEDATRVEAAHAIRIEQTLEKNTYLSPASKELLPYEGEFTDSFSKRAFMHTLAIDSDSLLIGIEWSSSAEEYTEWTMTATLTEDGKLTYTDEKRIDHKTDKEGKDTETVVYEDKEGFFTIKDGKFLWDGAPSDECKECVFQAEIEEPVLDEAE